MAIIKCKKCGSEIIADEKSKNVKCDFCGLEQENPYFSMDNVDEKPLKEEDFYEPIEKALAEKNNDAFKDNIEKLEKLNNRCPRLFIYQFMFYNKINTFDDFNNTSIDLERNSLFKIGYDLADGDFKLQLDKFISAAKNNKLRAKYNQASEMLNSGDYIGARRIFEELGDFKDSKEKVEKIDNDNLELDLEKARVLIKQKEFSAAKNLVSKYGNNEKTVEINDLIEKCLNVQKLIVETREDMRKHEFSDAKAKVDQICSFNIEIFNSDVKRLRLAVKTYESRINRKKVFKKVAIGVGSTVAAGLVVFFICLGTVIIPSNKYNEANDLIKWGQFDAAAARLRGNIHKDSKRKLQAVEAAIAALDDDIKTATEKMISVGSTVNLNIENRGLADDKTYTFDAKHPYNLEDLNIIGYEFQYYDTLNVKLKAEEYPYILDIKACPVINEIDYYITYDLNGGYALETLPNTFNYNAATYVPNAYKDDYRFLGWGSPLLGDAKCKNLKLYKTVAQDITLTANFEKRETSVHLKFNNGEEDRLFVINYNQEYSLPSPSRNGYNFIRWELNGTPINNSGEWKFDENQATIEAIWEARQYDIAYSNIHIGPGNATEPLEKKYNFSENSDFRVGEPQNDCYDFVGWTDSSSLTPEKNYLIHAGTTGSVNLYAHWEPKIFNVTFEGVDDTFVPPFNSYRFGDYLNLPKLTLPNNNFLGWETNDGKLIEFIDSNIYGDLILKPKFAACSSIVDLSAGSGYFKDNKKISITFKYKVNNSYISETKDYDYGAIVKLPSISDDECWSTKENSVTLDTIVRYDMVATKNLTLYANEVFNPITVGTVEKTMWLPENDYWSDGSSIGTFTCLFEGTLRVSPNSYYDYTKYNLKLNGELISNNSTPTIKYGDRLSVTAYNSSYNHSSYFVFEISASGIQYHTYDQIKICDHSTVANLRMTIANGHEYSLPVPCYEGHEFTGWQNTNGEIIPNTGIWNLTESNVTLNATWRTV